MADQALDCAHVDEEDYEVRYVQGALSAEEAEAFEEHYFGCDRCWSALERALDLHAAREEHAASASVSATPTGASASPPLTVAPPGVGGTGPTLRLSSRSGTRPRPWASHWWQAAAAAALILMVGTWRWQRGHAALVGPIDAERGTAADLHVRPSTRRDSLGATWSPVRGAEEYRVRLFTADGTLLIERELKDTAVSVARAAVGGVPSGAFWSVEAVDATRRSLARSRLTPAVPPPSP